MPAELSSSQRAAVDAPWDFPGHTTMVVATAGSGKTLTLARRALRVARDLLAAGRTYESVLCSCFGKDAQVELCQRINSLIKEEGLKRIVCPADSRYPGIVPGIVFVVVKTINSVCSHVVQQVATHSERKALCDLVAKGGKAWAKTPSSKEVKEAVLVGTRAAGLRIPPEGVTKVEKANYRKWLSDCIKAFDRQRIAEADTASAFPDGFRGVSNFLSGKNLLASRAYVGHMRAQYQMDFKDQIIQASRVVRKSTRVCNNVRERYAHLLVDEMQDVGATELAVIMAIGRSFTFVGDDDQGIFAFKSGVPVEWQALHRVRDVCTDVDILALAENRRSPPAAVNFAYAVVKHNSDRIPKEILPLQSSGMPVIIAGAANFNLEVAYIANRIRDIVCTKIHSYRDCVVVSRKNVTLDVLRLQLKRFAPDIPVARRAIDGSTAQEAFDPRCKALVALLGMFLPDVSKESLVETLTLLSPSVPVAQVTEACEECSDSMSCKEAIAHLRTWHRQRNESQLFPLLKAFEKIEMLVNGSATLRQIVTSAKCQVSLLGVGTGAGVSGDALSQYTSSQTDSVSGSQTFNDGSNSGRDGFELLLSSAGQIEAEADKLRDEEVLRVANEAAVAEAATSGVSRDDGIGFFAHLISHDVRKRENLQRKKQGCATGAVSQATTATAHHLDSSGDRAARARDRKERLAILVARAREMILAAQPDEKRCDERDAVRLITVHKAKGLEWPFVFVACCDSDNFPVEGHSIPEHEKMAAHVREERRVFFVAATRAKRQVTFTFSRTALTSFASHSEIYKEASPFLAEGWVTKHGSPNDVVLQDVCGKLESPSVEEAAHPGLPLSAKADPSKIETGKKEDDPIAAVKREEMDEILVSGIVKEHVDEDDGKIESEAVGACNVTTTVKVEEAGPTRNASCAGVKRTHNNAFPVKTELADREIERAVID